MTVTITAVSNQIDSGKTYLIQVIGHILAQRGNRVLLIDGDPNSHLTKNLLYSILNKMPNELSRTLLWAMLNPEESEYALRRVRPNLYVLPSNFGLIESYFRTNNWSLIPVIQHLKESYDYILIDTSSEDRLFLSATIMAADKIFVPLKIELYANSRIDIVLDILITHNMRGTRNLTLLGIIPTTQIKNRLVMNKYMELLRVKFGSALFNSVILLEDDKIVERLRYSNYENHSYSILMREFLMRI